MLPCSWTSVLWAFSFTSSLKLLLTVSWRHTDSQTAALTSCTKTTALNIDTDHGDLSLKSRWQTPQSSEVSQHVPLFPVLLMVSMHPTRAGETSPLLHKSKFHSYSSPTGRRREGALRSCSMTSTLSSCHVQTHPYHHYQQHNEKIYRRRPMFLSCLCGQFNIEMLHPLSNYLLLCLFPWKQP